MAGNISGSGGTGDKGDSHFPYRGGLFRGESSSGHGRIPSLASEPNPVIHDDDYMEGTIHQLEIEAFNSVLQVYAARGQITWEEEQVISVLKRDLRISTDEHLSIHRSAGVDERVQYIRALRESSQLAQVQNPSTSGYGGPLNPQPPYIANQPFTSARTFIGADRSYPTSGEGRGQFGSHLSSGGRVNELVGQRVRTIPDGNSYGGVITDYNPREGTHTETYDLASGLSSGRVANTVNLAWIPPGQRQWLSNDAGTLYHGGYGAPERAMNQARGARGRGMGRSSGRRPQSRNDLPPLPPPQVPRTGSIEIQTLDTYRLIREVERVVSDSNSTPQERAFAENKLREQEELLSKGIARLVEVESETDDDADEGMDDPVLSPPQEMIAPDENQILDTDSVVKEAERVLNDSNSTSEEKENASQQLLRVFTDNNLTAEERAKAYNIFKEHKRNDANEANNTDGQAYKGKGKIL